MNDFRIKSNQKNFDRKLRNDDVTDSEFITNMKNSSYNTFQIHYASSEITPNNNESSIEL